MVPHCRTYRSPSIGPCLSPYTQFGSTMTNFEIENKDQNTTEMKITDIKIIILRRELYALHFLL